MPTLSDANLRTVSEKSSEGFTTLDARGKFCPVPVIELAKAMRTLSLGGRVVLLATDPAVQMDLSAWCEATGNALVSLDAGQGIFRAVVERQR